MIGNIRRYIEEIDFAVYLIPESDLKKGNEYSYPMFEINTIPEVRNYSNFERKMSKSIMSMNVPVAKITASTA